VNPIVRAFRNRWLGDRGEREAARFLRQAGLRVLTRGYRTKEGEIDLIAREGDVLVFVEVKSRKQGTPAEAVTLEKQRRLTLAALHFLKLHGLLEQRSRFDVIAIVWPEGPRPDSIEHIRNAFEAVGRGQLYR
jgi:putative endonuclease